VTFHGPLKATFHRESVLFIKTKGLGKLTPYDLAGIFNKAYSQVAATAQDVSGFKATGIYPLNPNVLSEEDFEAGNTVVYAPRIARLPRLLPRNRPQRKQQFLPLLCGQPLPSKAFFLC
jgi:hypothetical protein